MHTSGKMWKVTWFPYSPWVQQKKIVILGKEVILQKIIFLSFSSFSFFFLSSFFPFLSVFLLQVIFLYFFFILSVSFAVTNIRSFLLFRVLICNCMMQLSTNPERKIRNSYRLSVSNSYQPITTTSILHFPTCDHLVALRPQLESLEHRLLVMQSARNSVEK